MNKLSTHFKRNYITSASNGYMQLTLLPTEKCNFRCVYCYEDFKIGKMSQDTIKGIKALLTISAPELKKLHIQWFGGEPTLNKQGIIDISKHIISLQQKYHFEYNANMTTNAYLLDNKMFKEFIALGISDYQITIDGTAEQHNTTRKKANGKGTFDTIWQNLCSFQEITTHFKITFRLHVMQDNTASMLQLSHMIKEQFGHDKRYVSFIRNIANLGGTVKNTVDQYVPNERQDVNALIKKMKKIMEPETHPSENKQSDDPYICYASKPRHLTIRADGRLAKCTVMFDDERNDIGKINPDGTLQINGDKFDFWTRGFTSLNLKELACPKTNLPMLKPDYGERIAINML
ncbi:radical SAM protein [Shewanella sp. VB17]|uniref:radical SAM protein n=1 Tax=Shewanella sp. VB17 TaxID=2739432 RepID=UPI001566AA06|nr:radical SAM protein [Shewanella sp. VB17]NRD74913.1 radical SAM protein [Shewanella sp. VB17]